MMIIKIAGLSEGVHQYRFDEPVQNTDLEKAFSGNIVVDAELTKYYSQLVLKADISVNAVFECDRCNKTFEQELNPVYRVVYLFGSKPEDNNDVNIIYLSPEADKIDIASDVRDYTLLSLPMKKLCSEDCKGLCPRCGNDLNAGDCDCSQDETDIRWRPLQDLKKKFDNN